MTESRINSTGKAELRTTNEGSEFGSELSNFSANQFEVVFARMMQAVGTKKAADVAMVLGISHSSVSGSKRRGNIPDSWYSIIADKCGVSMDWLRTGEGEMRRLLRPDEVAPQELIQHPGRGLRCAVDKQPVGSSDELGDVENFDMGEVLAQTIDILNSKTVYTTAIVSNIKAFHKAITTEKKIDDMQAQLNQALASFQGQLDKTNQIVSELQNENHQLRQDLEHERAQSAVQDTG